jgi:hypothetical protein
MLGQHGIDSLNILIIVGKFFDACFETSLTDLKST